MKFPHVVKYLSCILLTGLSGCATPTKTTVLGGGIGTVTGGLVGAIADPGPNGENRIRNVFIGSAVGGAVGAGSGYLVAKKIESDRHEEYQRGKRDSSKEILSSSGTGHSRSPRLLPARTEARWVSDQIRGSTFVPGHFEYVILEGSKWDVGQ